MKRSERDTSLRPAQPNCQTNPASVSDMALEMDLVRSVVAKIRFVEEVSQNPLLKTLSYVNTQTGHRILVYCRKNTVVCTLNHPKFGHMQHASHSVTYSTLVELLKNPPSRMQPQDKPNTIGQKRPVDSDEDEEFEPSESPPQAPRVPSVSPVSIAQTTRSKNPLTKKPNKKAVDNLDDEAEFDTEAPAPAFAGVPPPPPNSEVAVVEPEAPPTDELPLHKSRKVNARGNNSYWKLRYSKNFPTSATSVACFAQSHGGYVAVFDDGSCVYQGIPASVIDIIASQHNRNIAYIAIGEYEQHYVRMKNGREFYSGSTDFENSIRRANSTARLVAFGDASTYFILFEDGTRDAHVVLPKPAQKILSEYHVNSVWIGTNFVHNSNGYFISYQGTTGGTLHTYAGLPSEVQSWIEKKAVKSTQIKQLLSDGNCFIIRYS